jgi:phospholipid transport system substrate-binding protein
MIDVTKRFVTAAALALAALGAHAQEAPDALVKNVSTEVIALIKSDPLLQRGDSKRITEVVETKVLPHFNFTRMTQLAVGPNWRKATPEQQNQLTEQFRTLLVRTYSVGLSSYRDETIEFEPLRASSDSDVVVKSRVKRPGAQPVTIDYSMEKSANGWKVYDVSIGGVSLVTTYRDTFRDEVRQSGIDGLIKSLSDKNRQLAAAAPAKK